MSPSAPPRPDHVPSRGDGWVWAQGALLLLVALGPRSIAGVGLLSLGGPWRALGGVLLLAGTAALLASARWLGPNLTAFPRPRRDGALVTTGPYTVVRHPIYSAVLAAAAGWAIVRSSALTIAYVLLLAAFLDRKAAHEERLLSARFPDYAAYRRRVRKLIPFVY